MNCESLIHLVRAHPELYDSSHPNNRNRDHIAHIWRIIAQELCPNESAEDVKRKWSIIRSNYMREKRKLQNGTAQGGTSVNITWPYYDMLTFLGESPQEPYEYYEAEAVRVQEQPARKIIPPEQLVSLNEAIVNLVRSYEEIYDANNPKHCNREHIAQIWRIIGGQLKITAPEAKKRWANLRSNYMREKRKLSSVYPDGVTPKITWPYFELMSFLEITGEWTLTTDSFSQSYDSDSLSVDFQTKDIIIKSERDVEENENFPRKRKAYDYAGIVDTEGMSLAEAEDDKSSTSENEDPDFMFLRSLLPMMKMLGPIENLDFKGEVIELLKKKVQLMPTTSSIQDHY